MRLHTHGSLSFHFLARRINISEKYCGNGGGLIDQYLTRSINPKLFCKSIDNRKILGVSTLMNLASYGILLLII